MNFKKMRQIMENEYMGNKIPSSYNTGNNKYPPTEPPTNMPSNGPTNPSNSPTAMNRSKQDTNQIIRRIETKLGEERLKYKPLLMYLGRNAQALSLFNDLLDKVGTMSATTASNILTAR